MVYKQAHREQPLIKALRQNPEWKYLYKKVMCSILSGAEEMKAVRECSKYCKQYINYVEMCLSSIIFNPWLIINL